MASTSSARKHQPKRSVGPQVWLSIFLSYATIAVTPYTSRHTFLPNLLSMHALLFVPLICCQESSSTYGFLNVDVEQIYNSAYIASIGIHVKTAIVATRYLDVSGNLISLMSELSAAAWETLFSNPAQSSIGWDVIWTSISFIAWIILRPVSPSHPSKSMSIPYLLLVTPLACIGATAPYIRASCLPEHSFIPNDDGCRNYNGRPLEQNLRQSRGVKFGRAKTGVSGSLWCPLDQLDLAH